MRRLRSLWLRLAAMLHRGRAEEDFSAELEAHIAMHVDDGLRAGLSVEAGTNSTWRRGADTASISRTARAAAGGIGNA